MTIVLILVGVLIVMWFLVNAIQSADKRKREEYIRKKMEEKKKEEESKNRFPQ